MELAHESDDQQEVMNVRRITYNDLTLDITESSATGLLVRSPSTLFFVILTRPRSPPCTR